MKITESGYTDIYSILGAVRKRGLITSQQFRSARGTWNSYQIAAFLTKVATKKEINWGDINQDITITWYF